MHDCIPTGEAVPLLFSAEEKRVKKAKLCRIFAGNMVQ